MKIGCIAYKVGMSALKQDGVRSVPVTLLHVPVNVVTALRRPESEGYAALQVAACEGEGSGFARARKRWTAKPVEGHLRASGAEKVIDVCEFRVEASELENFSVGQTLSLDGLSGDEGEGADGAAVLVDVRAVSKGRGFSGSIKRWNFRRQPESHGNSVSTRAHGSTGQRKTPGRVMKGKKMAGHYGAANVCMRNLHLVHVAKDQGLLAVKGAVPGPRGGRVVVSVARSKKT